jgi:DNA-binding NarL/FixJ family response regulator
MIERVAIPESVPEGALVEPLTDRESQVLRLVASGCRNHEIARMLRVSIKTVEFHMSNIRGKLCVRSRTEAVVRACQIGLLDLQPRPLPALVRWS